MSPSWLMAACLAVSSAAQRSAEKSSGAGLFWAFFALTSVEKVHCRPRIPRSDLFTYVCLPASSFSSVKRSRNNSLFHAQVDGVRVESTRVLEEEEGTLNACRAHWRATEEKVETW